MEKGVSPLYQIVLAMKLFLPTMAGTQNCLPLLCMSGERETAVLRDSGKKKLEVVLASVLVPQECQWAGMDGGLKPSMLQVSMICRAASKVI